MEVKFTDSYHYPKKFRFVDKFHLPKEHKWLNKLPLKWRYRVIKFMFKLGLLGAVGYCTIVQHDPSGKEVARSEAWNIIPDVGVTQVRDILSGGSTDLLGNLEFGTGSSTPAAGDTDVETPLTGGTLRLVGVVTTPGSFEVRITALLNGTYGPGRPYTINNFAVFFDPAQTGVIFAHALVSPGHTMSASNTADATYGVLLR